MATTTTTKTAKGFKVICPFCGDKEAAVTIDLSDLKTITCSACEEEFSARDAVEKATEQLKQWQAVARWVEMAGEAMGVSE